MKNERQLREEMLRFGRLCYERNLLVAMDGNLSARLPNGDILCTQAGCHKGFLTDDELVVIDASGKKKRGRGKPTSEMAMHLACYEERPDVRAIVHAHPPLSIAFTIAGESMARCVLPEVVLTLGAVPTVEYETTGTQALADKIRPYIVDHDAILMDRHGAVCLGPDLLTAFCRLETMEHTALITKTARQLGRVRELPPEEAVKLRSMGLKRYGGPPSAVARADEPGADLPAACTGCSGCANPQPSGVGPAADFRILRVRAEAPTRAQMGIEDLVVEEVLKALQR
ncbi:MAG: class II aldolase/adducin family protein [Alphaproteobacteria bacterium]|nr:class II aldolase/adducin family protein [Alphaproteobacteria bacterium]MCB9792999.1 class II aldolase/adducin family protein [Alphaproteobacteria bacterium]